MTNVKTPERNSTTDLDEGKNTTMPKRKSVGKRKNSKLAVRESAKKGSVTERIDQQREKNLERLKHFRLIDDTFMTQCFDQNPESIELVLRIALDKPDLKVEDVRTQVNGPNLLNRSVRYDVLATDSEGRKYNIEIQRSTEDADPRRARYNSSMLDVNSLPKGADYDALPETYVIFITEHDVFGRGKPVYKVERRFEDNGEVFDDKAHIVYVNGAYRGDTPVGKLMHDFFCTDPDDMNYKVLADRVRYFNLSFAGIYNTLIAISLISPYL